MKAATPLKMPSGSFLSFLGDWYFGFNIFSFLGVEDLTYFFFFCCYKNPNFHTSPPALGGKFVKLNRRSLTGGNLVQRTSFEVSKHSNILYWLRYLNFFSTHPSG